ncbi:hypothetical protein ABGF40_01875, partial [Helcococcus bovis]
YIKNNHHSKIINTKSVITWLCGFLIYRYLLNKDILIGSTILDIIITMILCVVFELIYRKISNK